MNEFIYQSPIQTLRSGPLHLFFIGSRPLPGLSSSGRGEKGCFVEILCAQYLYIFFISPPCDGIKAGNCFFSKKNLDAIARAIRCIQ